MNYIICDDEIRAAESLKLKILELEPDSNLLIFRTLEALLFNIEDISERIDGVFMDIKLKGENGIQGAETLISSHPEIRLVYITGYADEYLQDLYCVRANALPAAVLVKPVEMKYLKNALAKIREKGRQAELLPIKCGGTVIYLNTADIISVTSEKRKLIISSVSGSYEIYGKISEFCGRLPGCFSQCHKSCVVNLKQISRIIGWTSIEMSDGSIVPISRTYKDNIKTAVTFMNS